LCKEVHKTEPSSEPLRANLVGQMVIVGGERDVLASTQ
jgi:hypothetical protein